MTLYIILLCVFVFAPQYNMGGITGKLSLDNRLISDLSRPICINQLVFVTSWEEMLINSTISNHGTT